MWKQTLSIQRGDILLSGGRLIIEYAIVTWFISLIKYEKPISRGVSTLRIMQYGHSQWGFNHIARDKYENKWIYLGDMCCLVYGVW